MTSPGELERWLRDALRHLYDPSALEVSPLLQSFGLSSSAAPASALRRLIIEAIRALEPGADIPDSSPLWSTYEILLLRYVQQCSQMDVADQLGLSSRHLRRKEQEAICYLAHQLRDKLEPFSTERDAGLSVEPPGVAVERDLGWLKESAASGSTHLAQALAAALQLVRPMATAHQVDLVIEPLPDLPSVAVHPVGLRQILVSLLSAAIRSTGQGRVRLGAQATGPRVLISLSAEVSGADPAADPEFMPNLTMVRQLVQACAGSLELSTAPDALALLIALPAVSQLPLLVIDDNQDLLELVQRYASGTRYRVHGVRDLEQALLMAAQVQPRAIVLDVMMPGLGGWEALGRLNNHPLTRAVPVIICTILPEKELALSLGASDFVHKPFTQAEFLAVLDRQIDPAAPAPG